MNDPGASPRAIRRLMTDLGDKNGMTRKRARNAFIQLETVATPLLLEGLRRPEHIVRWETSKIFCDIRDLRAAGPLVVALEDENIGVQWVAAEALIFQGPQVIPPLLKALIADPESLLLRQGAHHVLHDLAKHGLLPKAAAGVLSAIEGITAQSSCLVAASAALEAMEKSSPAGSVAQAKHRNS
jgi:hypothetical protein